MGWRRGLERSERAGERGAQRRQAGRQASMELEGNIRQGRAQAVHQRATSMPYAAAAVGSGAVVGKPEERGRKLAAERERKGKRWVGGREEGERCAYASLAWLTACGPGGGTARVWRDKMDIWLSCWRTDVFAILQGPPLTASRSEKSRIIPWYRLVASGLSCGCGGRQADAVGGGGAVGNCMKSISISRDLSNSD